MIKVQGDLLNIEMCEDIARVLGVQGTAYIKGAETVIFSGTTLNQVMDDNFDDIKIETTVSHVFELYEQFKDLKSGIECLVNCVYRLEREYQSETTESLYNIARDLQNIIDKT